MGKIFEKNMEGIRLNAYSLLREREKFLTTRDKTNIGLALTAWVEARWNVREGWVEEIIHKWYKDKGIKACTQVCPSGTKCMSDLAPGKRSCHSHAQ